MHESGEGEVSNHSQLQPKKKERQTMYYFQPNQLVFLVTHPAQMLATEPQIAAVIRWSNTQVKNILGVDGVEIKSPESFQKVSFTAAGTSHRPPDYKPPVEGKGRAKRPTINAPESFTMLFPNVVGATLKQLVLLGHGLNGMRTDDSLKKQLEKASLDQVSLNWVNSGANGGMGSGGPSAPPTPFTTPVGVPPPPIPYQFDVKNPALKQMLGHGQGVEVAILDTLPTNGALTAAFNAFGQSHPLIQTLLVNVPNGPLKPHPATAQTVARLLPFEIRDQPYAMPDHGLFVAGIIHSLAKDATLHLIEVLNPHGVGDVQSIAEGFSIVNGLVAVPGSKWVVNCSFNLNAPTNEDQLREMIADLVANPGIITAQDIADLAILLLVAWSGGDAALLAYLLGGQAQGIENACNILFPNSGVIAAAGNDTLKTGTLTPTGPRYPAISDSVVGVGALKGTTGGVFEAADYTNLADAPTSIGLTTFGGEPSPNKGVLGIYVGDIPGSGPSANGWAYWCGTSFSTPIITGVVAGLLSGPQPAANVQAAISTLFSSVPSVRSVFQEEIVDVQQS